MDKFQKHTTMLSLLEKLDTQANIIIGKYIFISLRKKIAEIHMLSDIISDTLREKIMS